MKIAVDFTTGIYPGAGIARYTRSLLSALGALDKDNEYRLFYAARGLQRPSPETLEADALFASHPNFNPVPVPMSVRQMFAVWQRLQLPLPVDLFTGPCDVVHSPDFVSPPHRAGADVITVHDLSFMVVPQYAEPKLAAFLGRTVPKAVNRADHIVAVSEQTKLDLVRLLDVPASKVTVAYNGIDIKFGRDTQATHLPPTGSATLDALPERFILHVGTIEPRKNLERLIEAYSSLLHRQPGLRAVALVLAGRKGWLYEPVLRAAEKANAAGGHVVFVDFVQEEELPAVYGRALAFAYPSLYEGFGLPAAEAMACGVPTLVSTDKALGEVTGDAAVKVDPLDSEAISWGLERLLLDDDLRSSLRESGPRQVAQFTWEKTASQVLAVYSEVAGKGRRA